MVKQTVIIKSKDFSIRWNFNIYRKISCRGAPILLDKVNLEYWTEFLVYLIMLENEDKCHDEDNTKQRLKEALSFWLYFSLKNTQFQSTHIRSCLKYRSKLKLLYYATVMEKIHNLSLALKKNWLNMKKQLLFSIIFI